MGDNRGVIAFLKLAGCRLTWSILITRRGDSMGSTTEIAASDPGLAVAGSSARPRLDSVDMLRDLVMVIMALDHTRGYFYNNTFDPTDLQKTKVALFLTRWIT